MTVVAARKEVTGSSGREDSRGSRGKVLVSHPGAQSPHAPDVSLRSKCQCDIPKEQRNPAKHFCIRMGSSARRSVTEAPSLPEFKDGGGRTLESTICSYYATVSLKQLHEHPALISNLDLPCQHHVLNSVFTALA